MTSTFSPVAGPAPIVACTVSRDVQNFDLLIEDMETLLGESWGDLGFHEAVLFLEQPDAQALEFIALAIDAQDEADMATLLSVISSAKTRGIAVVLIAEDVSPGSLHQLLRAGANEFVPYPLPENELALAVDRLKQVIEPEADEQASEQVALKRNSDGAGVLIAVQGLSGGCGASTFAVNLGWELATVSKDKPPRVCVIDLGLQFGAVATYLDLPRREAVMEVLSDVENMDEDSFAAALVSFDDKMQVLTAPPEILPLDIISPSDVDRLLDYATAHFDYVIVDLPTTLVQWTDTVLQAAQVFFAMIELDMRTAQNTLRLKKALISEDLPFEKLRFLMNRAPKFTDLQGKSRVKRLAESLGITIDVQLPDGGRAVTQACDHGLPLASQAAKNPLRREIAKLAQSLHDLGQTDAEAA
ncbi:MAG: AAA family ATPase [Rhodobacteraceae bacterium]|nr:AAA family ATPase [Paracoccaceae bacterium]